MINIAPYSEFCEWAPTTFLIFSENVFDPLIYYSHLIPIFLSLPLAVMVLAQAPRQRLSQFFFITVALFSTWAIFDLILWAHADPRYIMIFWSLLILIEPIIYVSAACFAYTALFKRPVSSKLLLLLGLLMLPTVIFLPTNLAIESFNLTNCWREVTEGPLVFYGYMVQIFIAILIAGYTLRYAIKTDDPKNARMRSLLAAAGTLVFLGVFSSGNIVGSWIEDWTIGQYGLFGMPILVAFMALLISRYRMFNTRILTAEILTGALGILTLGILFVQNLHMVRLVSGVTFVLIAILGAILISSVRREEKQRREIEKLADELERVNRRLKQLDKMKSEFVSIASHQLRSPLTSIRGYASMLLEGTYGKIPAKAKGILEHIADASRYMALSVEDYLNVSRIESGNMKYELSDFNLKDIAENTVDDMRPETIRKGLLLTFKNNLKTKGIVHADIGKTKQIVQNLIDNAMKYTPKGTIKVIVREDKKLRRIYVDVVDSGIGMSEDTMRTAFEKFRRARNANDVNVTGTGLGLFLAQTMARAMGGDVTAQSEGEGMGSTFSLEMPLAL